MHIRNEKDRIFYRKYYKWLEGCTIEKVCISGEYVALILKHPDGNTYSCNLYQDEEGNGPGFIGLPDEAIPPVEAE